jgi:hypothetical protein
MVAAAATIMATCPDPEHRNGVVALRLARRLVELNGEDHVPSLNLLAAALAETGDYPEAVGVASRALDLARAGGREDMVPAIEAQLALFREGRPYHQGAVPRSP